MKTSPGSIAEAIRMKRKKASEINEDDSMPLINEYNELNEMAADESFESDLPDFPQPKDSNLRGSRVDRIRKKMKQSQG